MYMLIIFQFYILICVHIEIYMYKKVKMLELFMVYDKSNKCIAGLAYRAPFLESIERGVGGRLASAPFPISAGKLLHPTGLQSMFVVG